MADRVSDNLAMLIGSWIALAHGPRPTAHSPTGVGSCKSITTATSFKRQIDELPAFDIHSL